MPLRPDALVDTLAALLSDVAMGDGGIDERLHQVVLTAVAVLDVDGAGLMLTSADGRLPLVAASNDAARALELSQERLDTGPCLDATRDRVVVSADDLEHDARWPGLWELLAPHGVRAVMSAPIELRNRPAGNLNVFAQRPRQWSHADGQALNAYAGVITAYLRIALAADHRGRTIDQLRRVLDGETKPRSACAQEETGGTRKELS